MHEICLASTIDLNNSGSNGLNGFSIPCTNAVINPLEEDARIEKAFFSPLLNSEMHDIILLLWRVVRIYQR